MNSVQPARGSYHHGDLANALTVAATQLARDGGPEAVVLREAARKVGVSATAAYRHFAGHGELMQSVKDYAQVRLAERMRAELAASPPDPDPQGEALRRMGAIGLGYLGFALDEPGLFRTAFCRADKPADQAGAGSADEAAEHMNSSPAYQILTETLDALVTSGLLPEQRRPYAEIFAWSSTHGLAMLLLDGPLSAMSTEDRRRAIDRTLAGVIDGLVAG
jgi:AcrR family transcriptional regulator